MKWQFGDEGYPRLTVEVRRDHRLKLVLVGVGRLPDNHPLELAIEQLEVVGIKVPVSGWIEEWVGVSRILVLTEQTWTRDTPATRLVRWYLEHQSVLNQPRPRVWEWRGLTDYWADHELRLRARLAYYGMAVVNPTSIVKGIIEP